MATTSTVPVVIPALLSKLNAALTGGVTAFESWPGPEAAPEMVVLGEITWNTYEIASIKAGRQQRQEEWSVAVEVYVIGKAGTSPASPATTRDRAFAIFGEVEDVLADTPKLGLTDVQRLEVAPGEARPWVFEKGWAYRVAGQVHVFARLR